MSIHTIDPALSRGGGLPASGSVNGLGNNLCLTPSTGKALRLFYLSYNPSDALEAGFRFGPSGTLFLRHNLTVAGAVIAKEFGVNRFWQGEADESLFLNLSVAAPTIWNAFYREVDGS